jgi:hypothetical protein
VTYLGAGAFVACTGLTSITIPARVANIGQFAFAYCPNLAAVYFRGNAPNLPGNGPFFGDNPGPTVYYLPGTTGWATFSDGVRAMLWDPQILTSDGSFGVRQSEFGFNVAGTPDIPLVIEASNNLSARSWVALQTCTLTNGLFHFDDPNWTNYPGRFYRIRSP